MLGRVQMMKFTTEDGKTDQKGTGIVAFLKVSYFIVSDSLAEKEGAISREATNRIVLATKAHARKIKAGKAKAGKAKVGKAKARKK
jgi:hypothetical protein